MSPATQANHAVVERDQFNAFNVLRACPEGKVVIGPNLNTAVWRRDGFTPRCFPVC